MTFGNHYVFVLTLLTKLLTPFKLYDFSFSSKFGPSMRIYDVSKNRPKSVNFDIFLPIIFSVLPALFGRLGCSTP